MFPFDNLVVGNSLFGLQSIDVTYVVTFVALHSGLCLGIVAAVSSAANHRYTLIVHNLNRTFPSLSSASVSEHSLDSSMGNDVEEFLFAWVSFSFSLPFWAWLW
jgi:hypothetical protein